MWAPDGGRGGSSIRLPERGDFNVEVEDGDPSVVRVSGDVDIATAPVLRSRLHDLLATGVREVVVDVSAVTFIDSIGMSVVMSALKRYRQEGGDLRLRAPSAPVRLVLDFSGLSQVITVED